jgi:cell pole-organizing protein PopZ
MEEILASIRRIIEDSDAGRKPEDEPRQTAKAARPEGSVIEVDAFRAELRGRTVADEAENGPVDEQGDEAPEAVAAVEQALPEPDDAAYSDDAYADEHPQAHYAGAGGDDLTTTDAQAEAVDEDAETLDAEFEGLLQSAIAPMAVTPEISAQATESRAAIISEHAGRQVAAAFGELSDAFAASRRKSFDELAEEMMRPMLQDWLDNNLPTLVERLVREEIERIARGR